MTKSSLTNSKYLCRAEKAVQDVCLSPVKTMALKFQMVAAVAKAAMFISEPHSVSKTFTKCDELTLKVIQDSLAKVRRITAQMEKTSATPYRLELRFLRSSTRLCRRNSSVFSKIKDSPWK